MSRAGDTLYSFETRPTRQSVIRAAEMADKLLRRLGVDASALDRVSDEHRRKLSAFTTACHLNIEWYDNARTRQGRLYLIFGIFTGLLVLAIPVAIFITHDRASDALAAQVGVIITGVLSAHRALASALEKRNNKRHFWKAQADLKSILYSFEDKWRECSLYRQEGDDATGTLRFAPGFFDDLDRSTRDALDIKKNEQDQFFSGVVNPFSGLIEILGLAGETGSTILRDSTQRKQARAAEVAHVAEMEATQRALIRQRDELEKELEALEASDTPRDAARRDNVRFALDALQRRLLAHRVELDIARTKLDAS